MTNPFKDYGPIVDDRYRYDLTVSRLPKTLSGIALDVGVENPFTTILRKNYFCYLLIYSTDANTDLDVDPFVLPAETFDYIFNFDVIEHLMNQLFHMRECHRVLRTGGKMFLTTPVGIFPAFMWSKTHFNELSQENLELLLGRAGFKITRLERFNKSPFYWWRMGIFRPTLRAIFGGWYYVEAEKQAP